MTAQEIYDLIKDVKPGVWKIGLTYRKGLPLLKKGAIAAGYAEGDIYKEVFRWCSANVNKSNTKAFQNARATAQQKAIDQGKQFQQRPTGFHKSNNADELNIIEYRDGTNEPCVVLKKSPNADKVKYFIKGQEVDLNTIKELIDQKVISSTATRELPANEVFYIYPNKIISLKIDGILHENLGDGMEDLKINTEEIIEPELFIDNKENTRVEHIINYIVKYIIDNTEIEEDQIKAMLKEAGLNKEEIERLYDIDLDSEDAEELTEAKFNGITLTDEDGLGLDENLHEFNTVNDDKDISNYYSDIDKANAAKQSCINCGNQNNKKMTESLDYEAKKWGYKNYKEYLNANS